MDRDKKRRFFLVDAAILPGIFIKVIQAKALLQSGEVSSVAEAVEQAGISRSAFYKYRDCVWDFRDKKDEGILTFSLVLRDRAGLLSRVLAVFAGSGSNILTINQSIPTNDTAIVTISIETGAMHISSGELISRLEQVEGLIRLELLGA